MTACVFECQVLLLSLLIAATSTCKCEVPGNIYTPPTGGSGVLEKIPSVGEVWIFSGITQCYFHANRIYNKILDCDWFSMRLFVT